MGSGLTKTYNDGANTITIAVDASYFNELAQDAVNTAITAGTGISKTYDDAANTIGIAVDTTVIADRAWVTGQVTTLSNTVNDGFLEVSDRGAALGVASLDSNSFVPSAQILEPVQDIVAAMTTAGRGLNTSYNDTTGALTITPELSARNGISVENTANNGLGFYLNDTINAQTKLTTPLVEAATVSATTVNTGDITVSGSLTVNGTTTTVNSTNVSIDDPMIYIGDGNQSNVLDLGIVAAFNNGTYQHAGLVRDASDAKWKLFSGVTAEPGTTVDFTTYTRDSLEVGGLNATSAVIGSVSNTEIQRLSGVTSPIQTQIDTINTNVSTQATNTTASLALKLSTATAANTYAPIASPTFTGTVSGVTKSMIGLSNVDNTTDLAKPISTATQTQLDLKLASTTAASTYAPLAGPTFTGTVSGITKTMVGLANVDNTTDAGKPVSSATQTALDLKANLASPTFTGTVSGVTKSMVGLGSVDNTADSAKPVSTAVQTALDLKLASATAASTYAPIASPTFTGTVSGITKSMVGLGSVDNTADADKPVSTAQQTALDLKAPLASPTFTGTVTTSAINTGQINQYSAGGSVFSGYSSTATYNYSTGSIASGNTKTVNLGTGGVSGGTTNINIGSAVSGVTSTVNLNGTVNISNSLVVTNNLSALSVRGANSISTSSVAVTSIVNNATSGHVVIQNVSTVPNTPSGGGVIYVEAGALKYKGSSGTITVLGVA
jgi:hypothetical protein